MIEQTKNKICNLLEFHSLSILYRPDQQQPTRKNRILTILITQKKNERRGDGKSTKPPSGQQIKSSLEINPNNETRNESGPIALNPPYTFYASCVRRRGGGRPDYRRRAAEEVAGGDTGRHSPEVKEGRGDIVTYSHVVCWSAQTRWRWWLFAIFIAFVFSFSFLPFCVCFLPSFLSYHLASHPWQDYISSICFLLKKIGAVRKHVCNYFSPGTFTGMELFISSTCHVHGTSSHPFLSPHIPLIANFKSFFSQNTYLMCDPIASLNLLQLNLNKEISHY